MWNSRTVLHSFIVLVTWGNIHVGVHRPVCGIYILYIYYLFLFCSKMCFCQCLRDINEKAIKSSTYLVSYSWWWKGFTSYCKIRINSVKNSSDFSCKYVMHSFIWNLHYTFYIIFFTDFFHKLKCYSLVLGQLLMLAGYWAVI